MTSFQLLVFDFDGTLVDTKQDIVDSVNRTLKELELRTLDRETLGTFIGKGVNHLISRSLKGTMVLPISWVVSWPLPASKTTSPAAASPRA